VVLGFEIIADKTHNQLQRVDLGAFVTDGGSSYDVKMADVDGDGDLDVLVANVENNAMYINDGGGSLAKVTVGAFVTDGENSRGLEVVDIDDDGDADVFVANWADQLGDGTTNAMYMNDGGGVLQRVTESAFVQSGERSYAVKAADIDGDGDLDVFVANAGRNICNGMYLNDGEGELSQVMEGVFVTDVRYSKDLEVVDIDGDDDLDVLVVSDAGSEAIQSGYADPGYSARPTDYELTRNAMYINVGDGDLRSSYDSYGSTYYYGGDFISDGGLSTSLEVADIDGDGDLDVFVTNFGGASKPCTINPTLCQQVLFNVMYTNEGGTGLERVTDSILVTDPGVASGLKVVDIDGDGDLDVLVAKNNDENNAMLINKGGGLFEKATEGAFVTDGGMSTCLEVADIDGDGTLDVLVGNDEGQNNDWTAASGQSASDSNFMYTSKGGDVGELRRVTEMDEFLAQGGNAYGLEVADVDSDGDSDILVAKMPTCDCASCSCGNFMYLNEDNSFRREDNRDGDFGETGIRSSHCLKVADIDGDGNIDVLFGNTVYLNENGGGDLQRVPNGRDDFNTDPYYSGYPYYYESGCVEVADFDRDGDLDVLDCRGMYMNNGGGMLQRVTDFYSVKGVDEQSGSLSDWQADCSLPLKAVDVNGDDYLDVLVGAVPIINEGGGSLRMVRDLQYIVGGNGPFGAHGSSHTLEVADMDGDGDLDILAVKNINDETCEDIFEEADYLSSRGCSDWAGLDCYEDGLSNSAPSAILQACPKTCGVCGGCVASGTFTDDKGAQSVGQTPFRVDADTYVFGHTDDVYGDAFKMTSVDSSGSSIEDRHSYDVPEIGQLTAELWEAAIRGGFYGGVHSISNIQLGERKASRNYDSASQTAQSTSSMCITSQVEASAGCVVSGTFTVVNGGYGARFPAVDQTPFRVDDNTYVFGYAKIAQTYQADTGTYEPDVSNINSKFWMSSVGSMGSTGVQVLETRSLAAQDISEFGDLTAELWEAADLEGHGSGVGRVMNIQLGDFVDGQCLTRQVEDGTDGEELTEGGIIMYMNEGGGEYRKVTDVNILSGGLSGGILKVADIDGDGDGDILVAKRGKNSMYVNEGGNVFRTVTEGAFVTDVGHATAMQVADIVGDGDLDVLVAFKGESNAIYTWDACPAGSVRLSGAARAASWCFDCPTYATNARLGDDRCDLCPAGRIGVGGRLGLVGEDMCIPCDAGRFRDAQGKACDLCPEGTYSGGGGAPCTDCPPPLSVQTQAINGQDYPRSACGAQFNCGAGSGCPPSDAVCVAELCVPCAPGWASDGTKPCERCMEGSSVTRPDKSACEPCGAGMQPNQQHSACEFCLGRTYSVFGECMDCSSTDVINPHYCHDEDASAEFNSANCDGTMINPTDPELISCDPDAQTLHGCAFAMGHTSCSPCVAGYGPNSEHDGCEACGPYFEFGYGWMPTYSANGVCEMCDPGGGVKIVPLASCATPDGTHNGELTQTKG
jgi:hypothetical protein